MTEQKFHVGVKAFITNEKNEILILRANTEEMRQQQPSHWDLPGGRIKGSDSIEETLRKEVQEELGVDNIEILGHFDTHISNLKIPLENETVSLLMVVYKCKLRDYNKKFNLSPEHLEYQWASVDEAKKLLKVKFPDSFIEKLNSLKNS